MTVGKKYRLIVVEDCKSDVFLIEEALSEKGLAYELESFFDGDQMIRHLEQLDREPALRCPDLILLDLNMPKRSGEEVLQRIRSSERCAGTPVVVMTSSDSAADRARASHLGATAFFRKPADLDQFMAIGGLVHDTLERRGSATRPQGNAGP